jgi:hypothetical protein
VANTNQKGARAENFILPGIKPAVTKTAVAALGTPDTKELLDFRHVAR